MVVKRQPQNGITLLLPPDHVTQKLVSPAPQRHRQERHPGTFEYGLAIDNKAHEQDRILDLSPVGVFAVFDGVSTSREEDGGGKAAECAKKSILARTWRTPTATTREELVMFTEELVNALDTASYNVFRSSSRIGTTAVAAQILTLNPAKEQYLSWASIGDSRLSIVRKDGTVEQVSRDESIVQKDRFGREKPYLANWLGYQGGWVGNVSENNRGLVKLNTRDTVLLMTDGASDAYGEYLSEETLRNICSSHAHTPHKIAAAIVEASQKHDDKSVISIRIS